MEGVTRHANALFNLVHLNVCINFRKLYKNDFSFSIFETKEYDG